MLKKYLTRRLACILLMTLMVVNIVPTEVFAKTDYEIWESSPYVTSGMTQNDINMHIARTGDSRVYDLTSRLPGRYLLTFYENQSSGYNYFNAILFSMSGSNYTVLSSIKYTSANKDVAAVKVRDLSGEVTNTNWYTSNGYDIPYYLVENDVSANGSGYSKDLNQLIITNNNKLVMLTSGYLTSTNFHSSYCAVAHNGILYKRTGSATQASPVAISANGGVSYLASENVPVDKNYYYKVAQKFDSYLSALGLSVAQTGSGMGFEMMMRWQMV